MARPKSTPEQRAEIRNGIQKAASDLYNREGISAISARAVAQKAGVSVGTIYAHFGDLTGLMRSLWIPTVERQGQALRALAAEFDAPLPRLKALLQDYIRFGVENAELYKGVLMFVRPEKLPLPDTDPLTTIDFADLLIETIKDGQKSGEINQGDPEMIAQMVWSGVHGCLALPVNLERLSLKPAETIADPLIDGLIKAIST